MSDKIDEDEKPPTTTSDDSHAVSWSTEFGRPIPKHLGAFDRIDYPDLRVPDPQDFAATTKPSKTIIYGKLPAGSMQAAIVFASLAIAFSIAYRYHPQGDILAASQSSVFGEQQWWQLITTLYVHADVGHYLANTALIVIFGTLLRGYYGSRYFPWGSLAMGILCGVITLLLYPYPVRLIGASGMLYAMVALWLVLFMADANQLKWSQRLLRVAGFSALMLLPSTYSPSTSYLAHAVGAVIGLVCGFIIVRRRHTPWQPPRPTPMQEPRILH